MKIDQLFLTIFLGVCLLVAGCRRKATVAHSEHAENPHEHAEEVVTFQENKGLSIPKETAEYIGLRVADIEEQPIDRSWRFTANVYRSSGSAQLASTAPVSAQTSWASGLIAVPDAEKLKIGQTVSASRGGSIFNARVAEIKTTLGTNASTVELLVSIEDRSARLKVGDAVSVAVESPQKDSAVTIQKSALLRTAEGSFVYTVSGEYYVRAPIKTGAISGDRIEVRDGLYAGDQVVVNPVMSLWMAELQAIRGGKACADGH